VQRNELLAARADPALDAMARSTAVRQPHTRALRFEAINRCLAIAEDSPRDPRDQAWVCIAVRRGGPAG
jgi:hypothetical protein